MIQKFSKVLMVCLLVSTAVQAQQVGLSFSYFIPKNGYFSTPISPFSIRGLGVNINRFMALETGASLYRMSGLNMKDLPFESKDPLIGPNFTIFIPAEFVIMLQTDKIEFDIKAGGFFFYGFGNKLNYGNFDRAIRKYEGWEVANADFTFKNNPGFGYHFGGELTINVTSTMGVAFETNYLVGQAKFPLKGNYAGGTGTIETVDVNYKDAKMDFTGLEFSISLLFDTGGGGSGGPKKKKRRR